MKMPSTVSGRSLRTLISLSTIASAAAAGFLAQQSVTADSAPQPFNTSHVLENVKEALGAGFHQAAQEREVRLRSMLDPMFAALPKNALGAVGAPAASYALNRLFVQQHGWQLKGLHPSGKQWADVSPVSVFGDRLSDEVRTRFDDQLNSGGLSLDELAHVAALLEHMVHGEAESRLRSMYMVLGHSLDALLGEHEATGVIELCVASYVLGANTSAMSLGLLQEFNRTIEEQHPNWPETRSFLRSVQREVCPGKEAFTFPDVAGVVEAAEDRFGQWQSKECRVLKEQLIEVEDVSGSGRVRLDDFYGSAIHAGKWQFSETVEYLRHLGAVDETDPSALRVIIPNYIYSPSNCLASSSAYAVCCIDECEELLGNLERSIGGPNAGPDAIVTALTTGVNRTLAAGLIKRLSEVAEHHGGHVPLHGRLFAQWLHHVQPRECPFPHVSGSTKPQRPDEWEAEAGYEPTATEAEMVRHIEAARNRRREQRDQGQGQEGTGQSGEEGGLCSAMWTMEEELVDEHVHESNSTGRGGIVAAVPERSAKMWALRSFVLLAAVVSLSLALAKTLRPACVAVDSASDKTLMLLKSL
mmetsp:Transcript_39465/g.91588  ORF Transcript_39465/g.91588 Transcript_39465/m.91588 type:complete len:585 (+) Transcript_39465:84-1838(+)